MAEKIIVIAGPTASGKTKTGIELAKKYNGEIVSADSMQIYRRMDIGTAKASAMERAEAVHHMIDVAEPDENYSVARYVEEAVRCCEDIISRGKMPIIVGGTGLYIDSLISGRDFADRAEDESLRASLEVEYDELGGEAMLEKLRGFDPERAEKLHAADKRRIIRAIEIYKLSGMTITEHDKRTRAIPPRYDAAMIVLNYADRKDLYARIDARVDEMVKEGLFEEVEALLDSGIPAGATSLQAIGYKEPVAFLKGEISKLEAIEQIKLYSRRYAKRQLTWFRAKTNTLWINWGKLPDFPAAMAEIESFLNQKGY